MIGPRPKPPYPWPNSLRLPRRKAVTIAIGLSCNEGIVLAADSQETISYLKQDVGKLRSVITDNCIVSFAGAGDTDYIDTALQMATADLHESEDFLSVASHLEKRLLEFFKKHISPWSSFPSNDRPDVSLLMGITMRKTEGHGLYAYSGTAFHRVHTHSIGAGMLIADDLIGDYCFGNFNTTELIKLAVYVLLRTKRQVDGCGGFTNILVLKDGAFTFVEGSEIEEMEKELRKKEKESVSQFKKIILALPDPNLYWIKAPQKKQPDSE